MHDVLEQVLERLGRAVTPESLPERARAARSGDWASASPAIALGRPERAAPSGRRGDRRRPAPLPRARGGDGLRLGAAGARAAVRLRGRGGVAAGARAGGGAPSGSRCAARSTGSTSSRAGAARSCATTRAAPSAPEHQGGRWSERPPPAGGAVHARGQRAARARAGRRPLSAARAVATCARAACSSRAPRSGPSWSPTTRATRTGSTRSSTTRAERAVALAARLRAGELTPCPKTCSRDGCLYPGDLPDRHDRGRRSCDRSRPSSVDAIERRDGDLFLDAGAGSGKTSVLVERFVQSVLQDGIDVAAILTITFTDKAAAEMRDTDPRPALRAGRGGSGARDRGRVHLDDPRLLRPGAARARARGGNRSRRSPCSTSWRRGGSRTRRSSARWWRWPSDAPGVVELIASYGAWDLRGAVQSVYAELRSRGRARRRGCPRRAEPPDLERARGELAAAAAAAAAPSSARWPSPRPASSEALERLERLRGLLAEREPWPGELGRRPPPGRERRRPEHARVRGVRRRARLAVRAAVEHRWARARAGAARPAAGRLRERSTSGASASARALDFEDLELLCRDLLRSDPELRDRYRARFERVMVDELQDTNAVQLELIDAGLDGQPVHGRGRAAVDLRLPPRRRRTVRAAAASALAADGARATLRTNFRSRPEILEVINRVFEGQLGDRFVPLVPGRSVEPRGRRLGSSCCRRQGRRVELRGARRRRGGWPRRARSRARVEELRRRRRGAWRRSSC